MFHYKPLPRPPSRDLPLPRLCQIIQSVLQSAVLPWHHPGEEISKAFHSVANISGSSGDCSVHHLERSDIEKVHLEDNGKQNIHLEPIEIENIHHEQNAIGTFIWS